MDTLMGVVNWIIENWLSIATSISMIVAGCSAIAKLTPTEVDDEFWFKVLKFIDKLAWNNKPTELKK